MGVMIFPSPGPTSLPLPTGLRPASPASDGLPTLPSELASNFDADSDFDYADGLGSSEPRRHNPFRSKSPVFIADLEQLVADVTKLVHPVRALQALLALRAFGQAAPTPQQPSASLLLRRQPWRSHAAHSRISGHDIRV